MASDELGLFSYEVLGAGRARGRERARPAPARAGGPDGRLGRREPVLRRAQAARAARLPRGAQGAGPHPRADRLHADRQGPEAIRAYARTPVRFTPLKSEPLLRLLLADLAGEDATRASLATLRADLDELEAQLDAAAAGAEALPHRERYLALAQGFLRRLLDLHRELIDEVERELDPE